MALFGATFNGVNWAFRMENVFTPGIVKFWTAGGVPLLVPILKPLIRAFQGPPEVSFEEWRAGINQLTPLISDRSSLYRAWVDGDRSVTQIEDYIELHAEIFVILKSERCVKAYRKRLSPPLFRALRRFLDGLQKFDNAFNDTPSWRDPKVLLSSPEWAGVGKLAFEVSRLTE